MKSVKLSVVCKNKAIFTKKIQKIAPAEMEYVKISTEDIKGRKMILEVKSK